MSPEDIIRWAQSQSDLLKQPVSILLADINNVSGVSNFLREAQKHPQVHARIGAEVRNGDETLYILMANTQTGFARMNEFLTHHIHQNTPFPFAPKAMEDVSVIYPFYKVAGLQANDLSTGAFIAITYRDLRRVPLRT